MENEEKFNKNNKIYKFKEIYANLVNTLEYDEDEEKTYYIADCIDKLSVYEIRENSMKRTRGGSFNFSLIVSKELENLGIENYLLEDKRNNKPYWVNLYKNDDIWYVADLTKDILDKYYDKNNNQNIEEKNMCADIWAMDFMLARGRCKKLEEIKDDGKKIEEFKRKSIEFGDIAEDTVNDEVEESVLEVQEGNIFKRIWKKLIIKEINNIYYDLEEKDEEQFVEEKDEEQFVDDNYQEEFEEEDIFGTIWQEYIIKKIKKDREEGKGILVKIEKFFKDVLKKIMNICYNLEDEDEEQFEEDNYEEQFEEEKLKELKNIKNNFKEGLKIEDIDLNEDIEETELSQIEEKIGEKSEIEY